MNLWESERNRKLDSQGNRKDKAIRRSDIVQLALAIFSKSCELCHGVVRNFFRRNDNVKDMVDHGELMKGVTVLWKDRNRVNVVLGVSPKLRKSILLNGHVKLSFLLKRCED
ncbi:hypothetical protein QYM36_012931 [Artemia franciscana]|uniref:Uncharacterized protein n=1 Tax=Artemia franciscana TaxID=6661 RepID=A0AA88KY91_ARTSF|nr:hypothetical protein QYM36_012931 [Artemia franciscana]